MTTREADLMTRANRVLKNNGESLKIMEITLPYSQGGYGLIRFFGGTGNAYVWRNAPAATSKTEGRICDGVLETLIPWITTMIIPVEESKA